MAGRSDSLVRNAVLAGVVLSREPMTRWMLGLAIGERFASVLTSWDERHVYEHIRVLESDQLVLPMSGRRQPRFFASPGGVASWKAWLVSPIDARQPLRDALARLRACRDEDFTTMRVVVDLLEEHLLGLLEQPEAPAGSPLTAVLACQAHREMALASLRWCHTARDEIAALAPDH